MTYRRQLDLISLTKLKSFFLFGPRSTGKSTLLRSSFPHEFMINLLKTDIALRLSAEPSLLREMIAHMKKNTRFTNIVLIDEIQKIPTLLDEVHDLIETEKIKFILTGSSARKLKKSGMNLLAGRAWQANLFPLTSAEIGSSFSIERYMCFGGLPQVYDGILPIEELDAYVNTYLKEEIKEESLVNNFLSFTKFLKVAAYYSGEQLNYSNISQETGIPATSVRSYFEILTDTFLGFPLLPWGEGKKRKPVSTAKFYFFDVGVANFLKGVTDLKEETHEFGVAFEHFMAMELRAYLSYRRIKKELTFWRTETKHEVDFIIGSDLAIEVKSTRRVSPKHLKGLKYLQEENKIKKFILVSWDEIERTTAEGIELYHYKNFLKKLWQDEFFTVP